MWVLHNFSKLIIIETNAIYFDHETWNCLYGNNDIECTDRLQNDSEENIQTIPTIGFNVEVLQYKNIKFQVIHHGW